MLYLIPLYLFLLYLIPYCSLKCFTLFQFLVITDSVMPHSVITDSYFGNDWFRSTQFRYTFFHFSLLYPITLWQVPPSHALQVCPLCHRWWSRHVLTEFTVRAAMFQVTQMHTSHEYGAKGMAKITQTTYRHSTNNESAIYEFWVNHHDWPLDGSIPI